MKKMYYFTKQFLIICMVLSGINLMIVGCDDSGTELDQDSDTDCSTSTKFPVAVN